MEDAGCAQDFFITVDNEQGGEAEVSPATTPRELPDILTPRSVSPCLTEEEQVEDPGTKDMDKDENYGTDKEGNEIFRAGTFEKIVDWIVFDSNDDNELKAFFIAFETVRSQSEMFESFISVYETALERPNADKIIIKTKSKRFISHLISQEILEATTIPSVSSFVTTEFSVPIAANFKNELMKQKHVTPSIQENIMTEHLNQPALIYQTLCSFGDAERIPAYPEDGILLFSSSQLAEAITWVESTMLAQIPRTEYFRHTKPSECPNITLFAQHFDTMCYWIVSEILATNPLRQVNVLKKFINLSVKLLDMKNFNGTMEIIAALSNARLRRCKKIWEALPTRYVDILGRVEKIMSMERNFRSYRSALSSCIAAGQPTVPYLAAHLKDLTFGIEGNAATISNGLINFERISIIGKILGVVVNAMKVPFSLPQRDNHIRFLFNLWWLDKASIESCSYSIEPSTRLVAPKEATEEFLPLVEELSILSNAGTGTETLPGFYEAVHNNLFNLASFLFKNENLPCRTRIWGGNVYLDCFSGFEAINIMLQYGLVHNREAGMEIGTKLIKSQYLLGIGKETEAGLFVDKYGAFYQFVTEDIPGTEERLIADARKIKDPQERTDMMILIAITSSKGGIKPQLFWSEMKPVLCFTGSDLVAWLTENMKSEREESFGLCSRAFSRQIIVPVHQKENNKRGDGEGDLPFFLDSKEYYYRFSLERPKQIKKQKETIFQEGQDGHLSKKQRRKFVKQGSTSLLSDLNVTKNEMSTLVVMLDPLAGIPPDISPPHALVNSWKGPTLIQWVCKYHNKSEAEGSKYMSSLHDRKIIQNNSPQDKKPPSMRCSDTFYHFPKFVVAVCRAGPNGKHSSTSRRQTISLGATTGGIPDKPGPVLYERRKSRTLDDLNGTGNTETLQETYEAVGLLLEMCHPSTGIPRTSFRISGTSNSLFSGHKFVSWLKEHKHFDDEKACQTFLDFAARGFLISIDREFPKEYSSTKMFRFSIEKGDKEVHAQTSVPLPKDNDLPFISVNEDPEAISALVKSRMGSIENPVAPVRKVISRRVKTRKNRTLTLDKTQAKVAVSNRNSMEYIAPLPALMTRKQNLETLCESQPFPHSKSDSPIDSLCPSDSISTHSEPPEIPIDSKYYTEPLPPISDFPTSIPMIEENIINGENEITSPASSQKEKESSEEENLVAADIKSIEDAEDEDAGNEGEEEVKKEMISTGDEESPKEETESISITSAGSLSQSRDEESNKIKLKTSTSGNEATEKKRKKAGRTRSQKRLEKLFASSPRKPVTMQDSCPITESLGKSIASKMADAETGVALTTHKYKKKTFSKSFTGTVACTWLNELLETEEELKEIDDPLALAQQLLNYGLIESLNNKSKLIFEPGNKNYYQISEKKPKKRGKRLF